MFLMRMLFVALAMGGCLRGFGAEALVDPKASAILNAACAQLSAAKKAEVILRLTVSATNGPAPLGDVAANYSLAVERPNKMALLLKDGSLGATVVCDGTNTITFIPKPPMYTVHKAAKQIGALEMASQTADMGSMAFIAAMFAENPRTALLAGVTEARYGGRAKLGDVECDRIDMKQEGLDWRLFATAEEKPLVRRIEVAIPEQLNLGMDFTAWKLNAAIPSERFQFTPPAEAKKVDKFLDEEEKEGEDSDLIGEALPKLKLMTVDGDNFDTGSLKGRVSLVVVWSGEVEHCVNAIKAATELAGARKGVSVYSINVEEKADKARIKTFLSKSKLNVKTALDEGGQVVEKFGIEGAPTTFLIDGKGVVRKAYLGYHADLKTLLGKEIDVVLAEKK
jgi:peroxiredoxin